MARFSNGELHGDRRRAVASAAGRVDLTALAAFSSKQTSQLLTESSADIETVAATAPTEGLALSLAVHPDELVMVLTDVEAICGPIGRGAAGNAEADAAADRLLLRFADHPDGPVAAVSLLYQNRDATAALILASVAALRSGKERLPAVAGTVRQAEGTVAIGSVELQDGELVRLEFGRTDLEFGAGPHRCPGSDMAVTIVDAVVTTISDLRPEWLVDREADG